MTDSNRPAVDLNSGQGDPNNSSSDLLSAALCAAGLDEFFAPPTTDDSKQQPSTSTASAAEPSIPSATVERAQEQRATHTPLPGITASASTSPDLPINASSQATAAAVGSGATSSAPSTQPKQSGPIQKMIKIVRADGTPVLVPLPKSLPSQGPLRILVATPKAAPPASALAPAPAPAPTPAPKPSTSVPTANSAPARPIGIRPPTIARSQPNVPSISGQRPYPAVPNPQRRPLRPAAAIMPPAPPSLQRPFALGRSRLLPAVVPSSPIRQHAPPMRQPPASSSASTLPSPMNALQKRNRLVHFNPTVGVSDQPLPSSRLRGPAPGNIQIQQRFTADHERNLGAVAESGTSLVGPMQPLSTRVGPLSTVPKSDAASKLPLGQQPAIVEDEDEEELGFAETYAEYIPAKLRSGLSHPDQVVETSSLSSVLPPDVHYHMTIPEEVIDTGKLSALQLEAVIYACQKTETFLPSGERAGYLIGDGPGVGKGRTIAGFIYENYLLGRKRALWFSVSSDLKYDSERDLRDIGAGKIKVFSLNKFKYAKISGKENGSVKKGVIFATYSSLIGESSSAKSKYRSRLKQLLQWCGKDFEGVIVFDECHRAKNLIPTGSTKPTKTGQTVLELQKALPKARVLYASATGATETRNMAYMTRLGLWGIGKPFKDFNEFITAVEKRGVGAMEIVAMDMKLRGLYIARQLSFSGVTFRIEEVPLTEEFIRMYDESVKLWLEARKQFRLASELVASERSLRKAMWSQFWAAHQRFFKYLCIAAKVKECVRMARENVKNGKCVVIGLQSTGEARTLDQLEEMGGELTDFVSTAKGVFQALIEKHFPSAEEGSGRGARKPIPDQDLYFGEDDDFFNEPKTPSKGAWKRKLVAEHRERKKKAKLEKDLEDEEWPSSSSSSDNDGEGDKANDDDDDSENEDSARSDYDNSSSYSSDDENEGSQSDTDTGDDTEDKFNPFADDAEEADPWENKMLVKSTKRKRKRKRSNEERDEELERQLEQALQEASGDEAEEPRNPETKADRVLPSVSANDFLKTTSSYLDLNFKPGRFASELGLNKAQVIKAELLAAVERLGEILPPNTLDQLIDELGGPEYVAEMTGRKGRVVSKDDGEIFYELRNDDCDVPLEMLNVAEREKFMNGEKHIAIISEAASSGISLQSDRRAKNQRRRVHITLELPWSADKAVQQFGRTHRSNQVSAPEYVFLISELAGEQRFASIVAKRLESLGALTHGDRRATESRDLSQFNLDTKYGRTALDVTLKSIIKQMSPIVQPPVEYKGDFFHDMRIYLEGVGILNRDDPNGASFSIEKDTNLAKFLNRLLGLPVMAQNSLFHYFSETLREVVDQAKRDCRYDLGIMDLGHGGEMVRKVQTQIFIGKFETGSLKTELHTVMVERGITWDGAMEIFHHHSKPNDGFYVLNNPSVSPTAVLVCDAGKKRSDNGERLFHVYRPNVGLSTKMETLAELKKRFKKVTPEKAEPVWKEHFDASSHMCQHEYWSGRCRNNDSHLGLVCDVGRRKRAYHILSGSVLTVWNTVENVLSSLPGRRQARMQVVRVRTDAGQKIVGLLIPPSSKKTLIEKLKEESSHTYTDNFE